MPREIIKKKKKQKTENSIKRRASNDTRVPLVSDALPLISSPSNRSISFEQSLFVEFFLLIYYVDLTLSKKKIINNEIHKGGGTPCPAIGARSRRALLRARRRDSRPPDRGKCPEGGAFSREKPQ